MRGAGRSQQLTWAPIWSRICSLTRSSTAASTSRSSSANAHSASCWPRVMWRKFVGHACQFLAWAACYSARAPDFLMTCAQVAISVSRKVENSCGVEPTTSRDRRATG